MIGEETSKIVGETAQQAIRLLFELLFKLVDRNKYNRGYDNYRGNSKKEKAPKVKFGELSEKAYNKMLKGGDKFRMVTIPAENLGEVEKYAKQLGASFFVMENEGNTAVVAVSEKSFEQFSDAIKQTSKALQSAGAVDIMNGDNLIPAEQVGLAEEILAAHDIPTFSFKNKDGSCMNVVPKEYSGQYKAAEKEIKEAAESVKSVKIAAFDRQGGNFRAEKISEEQAKNLARELGQEKVTFIKNGKDIFVKFPAEITDSIEKNLDKFSEKSAAIKDFETAIAPGATGFVTIDKKSLEVRDNGDDYFMRVPRSGGRIYTKLPKNDVTEINDGRTLKYTFNKEIQYNTYDADGNFQGEMPGGQLALFYEDKNKTVLGDKKSEKVHYNIGGGDTIEVYDKKNDKVICVGADSVNNLSAILAENGISGIEAAAIIENVSDKLEINPPEILYSDENIEDIFQRFETEKAIENMERYGDYSSFGEKTCVIYDEENNKYMEFSPGYQSVESVRRELINAGYSEIQTAAIMSKLSAEYQKDNIVEVPQNSAVKAFDSPNAELNNFSYCARDEGIVIVKADKDENGEDVYKYVTAEKGASRNEIEAALRKKGFTEDEKTVSDIMKCLDNEKLLPVPEQIIIPSMGYKVTLTSSQTYELSKDGVTMSVQKGSVDIKKTAETFGISEKEAERLTSKAEKATNSGRNKSFLSQLKKAAPKAAGAEKNSPEKQEKSESRSH